MIGACNEWYTARGYRVVSSLISTKSVLVAANVDEYEVAHIKFENWAIASVGYIDRSGVDRPDGTEGE